MPGRRHGRVESEKWGQGPSTLASLGDVRREMVRVYRQMLRGRITPKECNLATATLARIAALIEKEALERKLAQLEALCHELRGEGLVTPSFAVLEHEPEGEP